MRIAFRNFIGGALVAVACGGVLAGCSQSGSSTSAAALARPTTTSNYRYTGEVYLLRGLANVFSTGLDQMNDKFRARGVNSKVANHSEWQNWANDIITRNQAGAVSYPVIIMGHSLGANATVQMAEYLGKAGVEVAYAVAFDPTVTTEPGPNVADVVNYYIPNGRAGHDANVVVAGEGFTGKLVNYDVKQMGGDINHFNIEKQPELQVRVMTKAISLMKPRAIDQKPGDNR